jgi:tRNA isopentenyl-2-thiomethyl-A-37 hydroxylase MiaE
MSQDIEKLKRKLAELEAAGVRMMNSRGYSKELRSVRMLQELIKEQLGHAHIDSSARKVR